MYSKYAIQTMQSPWGFDLLLHSRGRSIKFPFHRRSCVPCNPNPSFHLVLRLVWSLPCVRVFLFVFGQDVLVWDMYKYDYLDIFPFFCWLTWVTWNFSMDSSPALLPTCTCLLFLTRIFVFRYFFFFRVGTFRGRVIVTVSGAIRVGSAASYAKTYYPYGGASAHDHPQFGQDRRVERWWRTGIGHARSAARQEGHVFHVSTIYPNFCNVGRSCSLSCFWYGRSYHVGVMINTPEYKAAQYRTLHGNLSQDSSW